MSLLCSRSVFIIMVIYQILGTLMNILLLVLVLVLVMVWKLMLGQVMVQLLELELVPAKMPLHCINY